MASLIVTITQGCATSGGVLTLTQADPPPGASADLVYSWVVLSSLNVDFGGVFDPALFPVSVGSLVDDTYQVRVRAEATDGSQPYFTGLMSFTVSCAGTGGPGGLQLDSFSHTDETVAGTDGAATIQASGGVAPLVASLTGGPVATPNQPATSGSPTTFTGLAAGNYTASVTDSHTPTPNVVSVSFTVAPYVAPVVGCQDEYASDYDPDATSAGACTYVPLWRSAWQEMAVRVAAQAGQTAGFLTARLRVGFRPGHPRATDRPLADALTLRATVGPDGYATFRLGPYLHPLLGAPDGRGGYRLDLNSDTATLTDLFVGYELRRPDGELLEHGYALNAAVPDAQLLDNEGILSPFLPLPVWPGFDSYPVSQLVGPANGFAFVGSNDVNDYATVRLPCPLNPLLVAWLAPGGGFGRWVFQGRPELGTAVEEGQQFNEAESGERRYSSRGDARRTVTASSGVFKGAGLMEGLRTLWGSPQVWYQPVLGGPWVPVTLEPGSFPAGRMGVSRQQVSISFTHAAPEWAQGQ